MFPGRTAIRWHGTLPAKKHRKRCMSKPCVNRGIQYHPELVRPIPAINISSPTVLKVKVMRLNSMGIFYLEILVSPKGPKAVMILVVTGIMKIKISLKENPLLSHLLTASYLPPLKYLNGLVNGRSCCFFSFTSNEWV